MTNKELIEKRKHAWDIILTSLQGCWVQAHYELLNPEERQEVEELIEHWKRQAVWCKRQWE